MKDRWQVYQNAANVTPSDTVGLTPPAWALAIGVAGNVKVDTPAQTGVTIAVPAAFVLPLIVLKVYATGTTATGIVALW